MTSSAGRASEERARRDPFRDTLHTTRDLEDAAAVIAVLTALAAHTAVPQAETSRSAWGSPAHRLGALGPGPNTWWTSGAAR